MKKNIFLAEPFLWIAATILTVGFFSPVVYITIKHISKGAFVMLIPAIPLLLISVLSFLGLINSLRKIEIYEDKILEKNLFGNIINHCVINEIIEVCEVTQIRTGTYFVIKDGKPYKNDNFFNYMHFKKTKKSSQIIRKLWRCEMKHYNILK